MATIFNQCETGEPVLGAITNLDKLKDNLALNCLPTELESYAPENYEEFLAQRRVAMAEKIRGYCWAF